MTKTENIITLGRKEKTLAILVATCAMTLLISNLAATKLWDLPILHIAVDGGLLIFPLSYVIEDIIVDIYDQKIANQAVVISMSLNLIAAAVLIAVGLLPAYSGWEGQEAYSAILGFEPRIMLASLTSYLLCGLLNNYLFTRIRKKQNEEEVRNEKLKKRNKSKKRIFNRFGGYRVRAILSSIPARIVDITVFEVGAFLGILTLPEFLAQATGAFFEGLIVELVLVITIIPLIVKKVESWLNTKV